jgi:hypothetical protein
VFVARGLVRSNFIPVAAMSVPKIVVTYLAARTGSLPTVVFCNVVLVGLECGLFVFMLQRHGAPLARAAKDILRAIAAAGATAGTLYATGLGWQPVTRPVLDCLAHGLGIGLFVGSVYGGSLALLWLASGRPAGPERFLLDLLQRAVRLRRKPAAGSPAP